MPISHGEGRYYAEPDVLRQLRDGGQIVFRYCDLDGEILPEASPNGALQNIAGVCNQQGNVLGMMPHPEHAVDPDVGFHSADGRAVIGGLLKAGIAA